MSPAPKRRQQCKAITPAGAPCKASALSNSSFCFFHDPGKSAQRRAARKAGGFQRSKKAAVLPPDFPDHSLKNPADIMNLMETLVNRILRGELDPRVANSVGYLSALMLKACDETNIERRLAALEANEEKYLRARADLQA